LAGLAAAADDFFTADFTAADFGGAAGAFPFVIGLAGFEGVLAAAFLGAGLTGFLAEVLVFDFLATALAGFFAGLDFLAGFALAEAGFLGFEAGLAVFFFVAIINPLF
jgi:hypothetical protein